MPSNDRTIKTIVDGLLYSGMSLKAKTFAMFLAGLLGGALAWMAVGRTGWLAYTVSIPGLPAIAGSKLALHRAEVGMSIGGLLGLLLGVADAFTFDRFTDRLKAAAGPALAGLAFGALALQVGVPAPVPGMGLDSPNQSTAGGLAAAQTAIAHGVVWAVLGVGLGIVPGLLRRAPMLIRQGAFGGVLGGLASGFIAMMVPASALTPLIPSINLLLRAPIDQSMPGIATLPAFLAGGALIGLFCTGTPYLFRTGSLRIAAGRNAGKEYLIAAPITLIGSGPTADIALSGDLSIASSQCSVEESADHVILRPVAPDDESLTPTLLNGKGVHGPVLLRSGDEIAIGEYRLLFLTRDAQHSTASEAVTVSSVPAKLGPTSQTPKSAQPPATEPKNLAAAIAAKSAAEITQPVRVSKQAVEITEPVVVAAAAATTGDTATERTDKIRVRDRASLHKASDGPKLVCLDGPNKGHIYVLPSDRPITIGRGSDRDIALVDDHAASREHAVVIAVNGRHVVRDEGSANGTMLNNLPLKPHDPHRLESNDIVIIGRSVLRYDA